VTIQAETLELLEWGRLCEQVATFAATKLGAIAMRRVVIPTAIEQSRQLLAQTQEVYRLETDITGGLCLDGIEDIGDALERAALQGILAGIELNHIASTLAAMRKLRRSIDDREDIPVLQALVANVRTYPEIEQEIYHCIDDRGDVTDRASEKLREIRVKLKAQRDRIYQILNRLLNSHSPAIQQPLITQRGDRFVIPVKVTHKDAIPGVVHDTSGSGSTLYIEPQSIINTGNQLRQLQRQEERESELIRQELTEKITAVQPDLEHLLIIATTIDLACARARYSLWLEANPPRFIDRDRSEKIVLRQLRHPLLIWQAKNEEGREVVPTDLTIEPYIKVVTITGPNTGGKTVTLKTLAIATLMAKIGLFIPAREPVEIPWFDLVLADIGDEQSLQQSLSTFSGHIRRISRIINTLPPIDSDRTALVLLDEVGAGTDPAEGSALAIALLRYLANHTTLTIATTHYGELKALKYEDRQFENASVEFDDVSLSPTYRLLWGIPGRSNALTIASRLGLDDEIIAAAKTEVADSASLEINQVIAGLEAQRREQEEKANQAAALLQQAEAFYREVAAKAAQLEAREAELKLEQEREVRAEIDRAKGEIASVIRHLQQGTPTAQAARTATEALAQVRDRHYQPRKQPQTRLAFNPQPGDKIRIPKLGQTAEVITAADDNGNLNVKFGIMKMSVAITDIESLTGEKVTPPPKATAAAKVQTAPKNENPPSAIAIRTSTNTVDVRGQRVMNAEGEIEQAIKSAYQAGILWIIHGKGTGKLREGVHEFLRAHPQVASFEVATDRDGGAGVTIAHLR
jgi:DNA mismatch repair protein MutS2